MSDADEDKRVTSNAATIEDYLKENFPGFDVSGKPSPHMHMHYTFSVLSIKAHESYKLQVRWPRLADKSNPPGNIRRRLERDNVAEEMRKAAGEILKWG